MALNIKPFYPKDHPEPTYPDKDLEETQGQERESRKDYTESTAGKEQDPEKLKEQLREKKKKKIISPKEILRRLNIIK